MRIDLLTKKVGMTQVRLSDDVVSVTLLQVLPHVHCGFKSKARDGYNAAVFAAGDVIKDSKISKPISGFFKKLGLDARKKIFEVRLPSKYSNFSGFTSDSFTIPDSIKNGLYIDVTSTSTGKGFAGVMKRHNFRGLEASHGVSVSHRSHGSTGQRQDPGKVFKGKKMAGHMGSTSITVQNLSVVVVDRDLGLIGVSGSVPGVSGSYVRICDSIKYRTDLDVISNLNGFSVMYESANS